MENDYTMLSEKEGYKKVEYFPFILEEDNEKEKETDK